MLLFLVALIAVFSVAALLVTRNPSAFTPPPVELK